VQQAVGRGRGTAAGGPGVAAILEGRLGNLAGLFQPSEDQDRLNYAPTYFPGVPSANEARAITVGVSQEVADIDFALQLIRTSRVSGRVLNADATPVTSGNVNLGPEGASRGGRGMINYGSRIDWDGSFSIANVPPGQYTLRARGTDDEKPQFASLPLTVGGDTSELAVVLRPGGTISGTLTFQGGQPPNDLTQIRVSAPPADPDGLPVQNARVDRDGRFSIDAVPAGGHLIRPNGGGLRGWMLKAVTVGGRDVTDSPIEVRSSETLANVTVVFTDKLSEVSGTVSDQQGVPITDFTVLAFSTDSTFWRPQSRHIMTARPDQNGKFRIRGLPAGEFYLVTVDPAEQGEWFDAGYLEAHRADAARVSLGEGDLRTQDFKVRR
jgi:hypothetical protein